MQKLNKNIQHMAAWLVGRSTLTPNGGACLCSDLPYLGKKKRNAEGYEQKRAGRGKKLVFP